MVDLLAVSYGVGAIVWHSCSYIAFCGAQHSYYNAIIHSRSGVIILIPGAYEPPWREGAVN